MLGTTLSEVSSCYVLQLDNKYIILLKRRKNKTENFQPKTRSLMGVEPGTSALMHKIPKKVTLDCKLYKFGVKKRGGGGGGGEI